MVGRSLAQVKSDFGMSSPVPAPKPVPKPTPAPAPKPAPKPTFKTYKVKSGDTLSSIASNNSTSWQQLVAWNKAKFPTLASDPNHITIGWVLRVSK